MLNIKSKLISAAVGISILGSTGVASIVHASPINTSAANAKLGVFCTSSYSCSSFASHINKLVSEGVINSTQASKVLDAYNAGLNFKTRLDALVSEGVINTYQESRILNYSTSSSHSHRVEPRDLAPAPARHIAPAPAANKVAPVKAAAPTKNIAPVKATAPAKNVAPTKTPTPVPNQFPMNITK